MARKKKESPRTPDPQPTMPPAPDVQPDTPVAPPPAALPVPSTPPSPTNPPPGGEPTVGMLDPPGPREGLAAALVAVAGAVNACGVRALGVYAATITPAATEVGTGRCIDHGSRSRRSFWS